MVEQKGSFNLLLEDRDQEDEYFEVLINMDEIWPLLLPQIKLISNGDFTVKSSAKAIIGYISRSIAMSLKGKNEYPQPPLKTPKGENFIENNLKYLIYFFADVLNQSGGITFTGRRVGNCFLPTGAKITDVSDQSNWRDGGQILTFNRQENDKETTA